MTKYTFICRQLTKDEVKEYVVKKDTIDLWHTNYSNSNKNSVSINYIEYLQDKDDSNLTEVEKKKIAMGIL